LNAVSPSLPTVAPVYGFDEAPEAFAHLRTASHFGKIVVTDFCHARDSSALRWQRDLS